MTRFDAIKTILRNLSKSELVITTTGMISRETFAAKDRPENFYMVGSMGLVTPLALGLALNCPEKKIIGVEGDGSAFLNLGSLPMVAKEKPDNLITIILDNGCYESTGGQPCVSQEVDLAKIAQAAGYAHVDKLEFPESLKEKLPVIIKRSGPNFVLIKVDSCRAGGTPRVSLTPEEIKERFMKTLK